jgi:DNA-binding LacI/PurR family transcriptional regulator
MTENSLPLGRSLNLEDIAAQAGVSRSTVSRVINNAPYVSERTRQRVMEVIQREGFAPNPVARALVTQRSQVIGVVIPQAPSIVFEDAFYFPALLQGISRAAQANDYAMLVWLAQSNQDEEHFYRRIINNRLMDGVILASAASDNPLIDHFLQTRVPFVLVERPGHHYDHISFVTVDNTGAAYEIVSYLLSLGHARVGTITGRLTIPDGRDRLAGYKQAIVDSGQRVNPDWIVEGDFTHLSGYNGMKRLFTQGVDAVFAASDITARGAIQALHELGARVPEDVAVVGFDDLPTSVQVVPPLTTIRQPIEEKGARATSILIEQIETGNMEPQQVLLPTELIVRESCGAARPRTA